MMYEVAEKFKSVQGEGVYAGTPMAFIRFTGCSVGKKICTHCDTDFDKPLTWRGGGTYEVRELLSWSEPYEHICLTGGEPLDQDLDDLAKSCYDNDQIVHVETSGTKYLSELMLRPVYRAKTWFCVSPKPGFREDVVLAADEIKVIVPGLGEDKSLIQFPGLNADSPLRKRWPTLTDALRWADAGKIVFLQPRMGKHDIDKVNLKYVLDLLKDYPQFRLSCQLHKMLGEQ